MKKIHVKTGVPYDICLERGLLPRCGELIGEITSSRHTVIVTDDRVNKLYTATVRKSLEQSGFKMCIRDSSGAAESAAPFMHIDSISPV